VCYLLIFRRPCTNNTWCIVCVLCQLAAPGLECNTPILMQPTELTRTQYSKCRLFSASWGWESNARNILRPWIPNKFNKCASRWLYYTDSRFVSSNSFSMQIIIDKSLHQKWYFSGKEGVTLKCIDPVHITFLKLCWWHYLIYDIQILYDCAVIGSVRVAFLWYHLANRHFLTTLTEGFLCFFLSFKANARE
jgi:hypothetical protein